MNSNLLCCDFARINQRIQKKDEEDHHPIKGHYLDYNMELGLPRWPRKAFHIGSLELKQRLDHLLAEILHAVVKGSHVVEVELLHHDHELH